MGEVYRARDVGLRRNVAIKVLPAAFSADADRRARFEREAQLLAALNHPHIGAIYGFEQREGVHALVLELFEGQTLAETLRSGPLPVQTALTIARQIADALEAAHDKGIVHRDLKPGNIGLTHDGVVKVFDFGLAKAGVDDSTRDLSRSPTLTIGATYDGVILGTAGYMSPEQARGKPVDKRTDIWAFGCVLLEMLTGRKTFSAETVSDTIVLILDRDPNWAALPASTPPGIRRLLRRCLEKDRKRRVHHIADARIEIDDALHEPAVSVLEPPTLDGDRRAVLSRPMRWAAAAASAALLGLGIVVGATWRPAVPASSGGLARLTIALPSDQLLQTGRFTSIALSPDGKLIVYAAARGGGRTTLFLRPLDDLIARPIPGTTGAVTPFFSPDGRWLAFYADGALKKVPTTGGVPLTICEVPPVWSANWGDQDRILFATTAAPSGLWLVSANGGDAAQLTTPHADETRHGYPQILRGASRVLFSVQRDNGWRLALLDLERRTWQLLGNGRVIGEGAQYLPTGHLVYAQAGGIVVTPFDPTSGTLDQAPVSLDERLDMPQVGDANFAVASDAGTLVYASPAAVAAERTLVRVDRDGRATRLIDARAAYESPTLSPDGRRVAVTIGSNGGGDIWIVDLDRSARVRFTRRGAAAFPVWVPDGSRLAFLAADSGPWTLFSKPLDGSSTEQPVLSAPASGAAALASATKALGVLPGTIPTLTGAGPQFPGSWSPDGTTLAFHERKAGGERDIWTVARGQEPMPFLLTPFDERSPRFSPDGRWLAYVSDESGRDEVYVQPFPGPGAKWLVSTDGGREPVWGRDGRELFYRAGDLMMAVPLTFTREFSAGRPLRLFEFRAEGVDDAPVFDVSHDGRWFVLARSEREPPPREFQVVLNWFGEVSAHARASGARASIGVEGVAALWR